MEGASYRFTSIVSIYKEKYIYIYISTHDILHPKLKLIGPGNVICMG
jgi:hypothetical protein